MDITTPKGWRKGQTIFNFLEWLHKEKGYENDTQIQGLERMADPFYIEDTEIDRLYDEFIMKHI